jgi:O-antigen/teichoic acid export membrane protein
MGGLMGLQRQKPFNLVNCIAITVRSVGAYLVIAYISPTIQAFLTWQVFISFLTVVAMALVYWRYLPRAERRAKFQSDLLREVWRYAAGMTGISLVGLILTQSDKIILSRLLTLEYFGYYTLATTLAATGIGMITGSIGSAYFPQYSQLVALGDENSLRNLYHRSCQIMSVFLIPSMLILTFFSFEILLLWTKNTEIAANTYILLSLVALGTGLNGLMHLPYFIQLANGVTKLALWQNIGAIILLVPFMIYATLNYGAIGGAATWVILNLLYVLVGMQIMHRIFLKGELKRWYFEDVGLIVLTILIVVGLGKWLIGSTLSRAETIAALSTISVSALAAAAFAAPEVRRQLTELYKTKVSIHY